MTDQLTIDQAINDTRAICELVTGDPMHAAERDAIIRAIRHIAHRDGTVTANTVRPHIPTWVGPRVIAATYNALIARRLLRPTGEWTVSTDARGRNVGKPQRTYTWHGGQA